jgi:hypothetical protein
MLIFCSLINNFKDKANSLVLLNDEQKTASSFEIEIGWVIFQHSNLIGHLHHVLI